MAKMQLATALTTLLLTFTASAAQPSVPKAVRSWATFEATFNVCLNSGDLAKHSTPQQNSITLMSVEVFTLSNRLHDPLSHRMEIVLYDNALKQFNSSPEFKQKLYDQAGGPCNYGTLFGLKNSWAPVKAVLERLVSQ